MNAREDFFRSLTVGLSEDDLQFVLDRIERTRAEQLHRKRHPPRRRRRDASGELVYVVSDATSSSDDVVNRGRLPLP
jgi:hypothetical protein